MPMTPEEQARHDYITECRRTKTLAFLEEYDFLMPRVFPTLTSEEEELIQQARQAGYRNFVSSHPSLEQQAIGYLEGAKRFLEAERLRAKEKTS